MVDPSSEPNPAKGIALACTTAFMWGFLAICLKYTVAHVGATTIVWFRFLLAFSALFALVAVRKPAALAPLKKPPLLAVAAGILLGLNYLGFMKGIELTTPGNAQILIQFAPISLALCGVIIFKERFNLYQIIGVGVAGTGFLLFYRDQITSMLSDLGNYTSGNLWILFAGITWTAYAVLNKILLRTLSSNQINLVIYGVAALMLIVVANPLALLDVPAHVWPLMIFLGANTLVAYGCLAESFRHIPAYQVSFILVLNPLITLALMEVIGRMGLPELLPQQIGPKGWIGAALVMSGAVIINVVGARKR